MYIHGAKSIWIYTINEIKYGRSNYFTKYGLIRWGEIGCWLDLWSSQISSAMLIKIRISKNWMIIITLIVNWNK